MDLKTLERLVRAGTITVEEVLAHAGVDRLDQTVTMLRRHRAAKEVCAALVQRIASTVHAPAVPLWVDGDPVRLGQIVANLLAHAVK